MARLSFSPLPQCMSSHLRCFQGQSQRPSIRRTLKIAFAAPAVPRTVVQSNMRDKRLHFLSCKGHDSFMVELPFKFFSIIRIVFLEDQDFRLRINRKLLAKLLIFKAIDCCDFNDAVHLLSKNSILIFNFFAFFFIGFVEE